MKKFLLLLVFILYIANLSACDKSVDEISQESDSSTVSNSDAVTVSQNVDASKNEQDLLNAVADAETVYEWFYGLTGPPYKTNGVIVETDEIRFDEVEIEGVANRNEFYEYLCSYFSEEIATELFTTKVENDYLFKDIDGKLFCYGGYVGLKFFSINNKSVVIKEKSDKKIILTLTITATNDYDKKSYTATYDYVYEKQSNGNWVFTDFKLPYYLIMDHVG